MVNYLLIQMLEKDVFEYMKYEQMRSSTHEFTKIKSNQIMPHFSEGKKKITRHCEMSRN